MDVLISLFFTNCCYRQALLSNRGSDSDKLNPTHVSSSRAPLHLGHTGRPPHHLHGHPSLHDNQQDDEDKLLDVVGPPQSPLLPLSHSLQQMHAHQHSGKCFIDLFISFVKEIFSF